MTGKHQKPKQQSIPEDDDNTGSKSFWEKQNLRAGTALSGNKAQNEAYRVKAIALLQSSVDDITGLLDREGILTPVAALALMRREESAYLLFMKTLTDSGLLALHPMLIDLVKHMGEQITEKARQTGREELNEVFYCLPDAAAEALDKKLLGEG